MLESDISIIIEKAKEFEIKGEYRQADVLLSSVIDNVLYNMGLDTLKKQDQDFTSIASNISILLNQRGIVRRMLEQYDAAFNDYEKAVRLSEISQDNEQRALAHINIADIYRVARNDFKSAHISLEKALKYAEKDSLVQAKAIDQQGLIFLAQKEHGLAIDSYKQARGICEKLLKSEPKSEDIANRFGQVIHHLGVAYVFSGKPELVEEAYQSQLSALETFTKLGDQQGIVNTVSTLGKIAMIKKDLDEALTQYSRAWKILEKTGYGRGITGLSLDIAEIYLTKEEPEEAMPYLERFSTGVKNHELSKHDIGLIKDQFDKVFEMYRQAGMPIPGFSSLRPLFD